MLQEAESPPTLRREPETMFTYPEGYILTKRIAESDFHSSTSGEEELDDSEDEDECQ